MGPIVCVSGKFEIDDLFVTCRESVSRGEVAQVMTTRSSARIAALSPPPSSLSASKAVLPSNSRSNITVSSMPWTQSRLDEYRVNVVDTSDLSLLLPPTDKTSSCSQGGVLLTG